jgi:hypothetical protein
MPTIEQLMKQALSKAQLEPDSPYWRGYIHGLWKVHYGRDISPDDELGDDYRNGPSLPPFRFYPASSNSIRRRKSASPSIRIGWP